MTMNQYLFLFFFSFALNFVSAQSNIEIKSKTEQYKFTDKSIIKDSTGDIYPAKQWQPLVQTRFYGLKPINPTNPEEGFLIYHLTKKEKYKRDSIFFNQVDRYPMPFQTWSFSNGNRISDFKTKDIDGKKIDLNELHGKIIVLYFWYIKCPWCIAEIPVLNSITEHFENNSDVVFIAVGLDNKFEIRDFIKTIPFNFVLLYDCRFLTIQYSIPLFPTHVIIDRKGIVRFSSTQVGNATTLWLKKTIDDLLKE